VLLAGEFTPESKCLRIVAVLAGGHTVLELPSAERLRQKKAQGQDAEFYR
jgi:hypothetical protein